MSEQLSYARVKSLPKEAQAYNARNKFRHAREMKMIAEAFSYCPGIHSVLDAPCGVGRATIWLASQGYHVNGLDLGDAALELAAELIAEKGYDAVLEKRDLFDTRLPSRSFDAVLCFRLMHHYESKAVQQRLVQELCRLSEQYVVISRISPLSWTSMRRQLRQIFTGKPIKQYPTSAAELSVWFASQGFREIARIGPSALVHSLQVQVYRRE